MPQKPLRRTLSFGFGTSTADLDGDTAPAEHSTKLFSIRRLTRNVSRSNNTQEGKKKGFRRTKSFSTAADLDPTPSPAPIAPTPARPEAKSIGALHQLFSAGLSLLKGLTSVGGETEELMWGAAHTIGRRPYMEDRFCAEANLTPHSTTQSLFGVFDGHGGDLAAQYCSDSIPVQLRSNKKLQSDPEACLKSAFERVDKDFCHVAQTKMLDDGTTSVVALIRGRTVWCANAGDSRCILSRKAIAFPLSEDHKPNRPDERKRIVSAGGFVKHLGVWRTQGVLAVSRAIGDLSLKQYVIPTPDVVKVDLEDGDDFLVLASDGLWDVMENQKVVDILSSRPALLQKPEQAARALVTEAYRLGSFDNITAVVVVLRPPARTPQKSSRGLSSRALSNLESMQEE